MDIIHKCKINARWDEKNLITHRTFGPIPHERVIFGDIMMFEEENKIYKVFLKA
jgi:hypothetical protein